MNFGEDFINLFSENRISLAAYGIAVYAELEREVYAAVTSAA